MSITLFTTHCPRCKVLEAKLAQKGVTYDEVTDIAEMEKLGIMSVPTLCIDQDDEYKLLNFKQAVDWIGGLSSENQHTA